MGKPQIKLQLQSFPYKKPEEYAYIESSVTGKRYDDIVDMVKEEKCRWDGNSIIDEFGDRWSEKGYRAVMGVISYG